MTGHAAIMYQSFNLISSKVFLVQITISEMVWYMAFKKLNQEISLKFFLRLIALSDS